MVGTAHSAWGVSTSSLPKILYGSRTTTQGGQQLRIIQVTVLPTEEKHGGAREQWEGEERQRERKREWWTETEREKLRQRQSERHSERETRQSERNRPKPRGRVKETARQRQMRESKKETERESWGRERGENERERCSFLFCMPAGVPVLCVGSGPALSPQPSGEHSLAGGGQPTLAQSQDTRRGRNAQENPRLTQDLQAPELFLTKTCPLRDCNNHNKWF